mmetsp:Transcript_3908/g.7498  ORF Transcript_3908/g.7498 Transcript_3908/m.7498 type:complete len:108 (+) Transcript_3908:1512-1835(+)
MFAFSTFSTTKLTASIEGIHAGIQRRRNTTQRRSVRVLAGRGPTSRDPSLLLSEDRVSPDLSRDNGKPNTVKGYWTSTKRGATNPKKKGTKKKKKTKLNCFGVFHMY